MIQKQYKPLTPSKRFFRAIKYLDNTKVKKKNLFNNLKNKNKNKTILNSKINLSLRTSKRSYLLKILNCFFKKTTYINSAVIYNKVYKKEYNTFTNIYNQLIIYPALESLFIGFKLSFFANNTYSNSTYLINSIVSIEKVPSNFFISFIMNNNNNKFTFSKSIGCSSKKLKSKKFQKLALIKLSSSINIFMSGNTFCILGINTNIFWQKFIFGKFGSSFKSKYSTNVRGVAKNPIDHPNGGRTKSKSPELSPWGWIAKHNN